MPKRKKLISAKIPSIIIGCEGEQDEVFLEHLWKNFKREGRKKPRFIKCDGGGDLENMKTDFCRRMNQYLPAISSTTKIYLFLDKDKKKPDKKKSDNESSGTTSKPKIGKYEYEIILIEPECLEGFILEKILNKKLDTSSEKDSNYYKNEAKKCMKKAKYKSDNVVNRQKAYYKYLKQDIIKDRRKNIPLLNEIIKIFEEY